MSGWDCGPFAPCQQRGFHLGHGRQLWTQQKSCSRPFARKNPFCVWGWILIPIAFQRLWDRCGRDGAILFGDGGATLDVASCVQTKPRVFRAIRFPRVWAALERVAEAIPDDVLLIADAKRGDIGNTATRYAQAMFEGLGADAVTVAPYMGRDSVEPFTAFSDRWTVLLALTSNPGADDFEFHGDQPLFMEVLDKSQSFAGADRLMYVVGATRPEMLGAVRNRVPEAFLLVPGVGAQGGTVAEVAKHGMNDQCGLLVNSSRGHPLCWRPKATMEESQHAASKLRRHCKLR